MAKRSILLVKHIDYETGGHATRLVSHLPTREAVFETALPSVDELAGLVILGGEMSAADVDGHPSLRPTAELALAAIEAEVPVMGLCLGHQIIAHALGAAHHEGAVDEVGIVDVELVVADPWLGGATGTLRAMQWHSDTVDLPAGATLVATNETTANQAFRYGSALGLQFHLEVDERVLRLWDAVPVPPIGERVAGGFDALMRDYRANERLQDVAERGFSAFAAAAQLRL